MEARLDALYACPLDEFVSRRGALAAELAAEGERSEAAVVRRLRKPTVAAWGLNQITRREADRLAALFDLDGRLRAGVAGAAAFRETQAERRRLVADLAAAGMAALVEAGNPASSSVKERLVGTLLAVAGDAEAADLLRRGRLTREVQAGSFAATPEADARTEPAPAAERRAEARRRVARLSAEAVEAEREARRLAVEAEDAERAASRARRAADEAAALAEQSRRSAAEAERDAAELGE